MWGTITWHCDKKRLCCLFLWLHLCWSTWGVKLKIQAVGKGKNLSSLKWSNMLLALKQLQSEPDAKMRVLVILSSFSLLQFYFRTLQSLRAFQKVIYLHKLSNFCFVRSIQRTAKDVRGLRSNWGFFSQQPCSWTHCINLSLLPVEPVWADTDVPYGEHI